MFSNLIKKILLPCIVCLFLGYLSLESMAYVIFGFEDYLLELNTASKSRAINMQEIAASNSEGVETAIEPLGPEGIQASKTKIGCLDNGGGLDCFDIDAQEEPVANVGAPSNEISIRNARSFGALIAGPHLLLRLIYGLFLVQLSLIYLYVLRGIVLSEKSKFTVKYARQSLYFTIETAPYLGIMGTVYSFMFASEATKNISSIASVFKASFADAAMTTLFGGLTFVFAAYVATFHLDDERDR